MTIVYHHIVFEGDWRILRMGKPMEGVHRTVVPIGRNACWVKTYEDGSDYFAYTVYVKRKPVFFVMPRKLYNGVPRNIVVANPNVCDLEVHSGSSAEDVFSKTGMNKKKLQEAALLDKIALKEESDGIYSFNVGKRSVIKVLAGGFPETVKKVKVDVDGRCFDVVVAV